jgi:hypothetical protein
MEDIELKGCKKLLQVVVTDELEVIILIASYLYGIACKPPDTAICSFQ